MDFGLVFIETSDPISDFIYQISGYQFTIAGFYLNSSILGKNQKIFLLSSILGLDLSYWIPDDIGRNLITLSKLKKIKYLKSIYCKPFLYSKSLTSDQNNSVRLLLNHLSSNSNSESIKDGVLSIFGLSENQSSILNRIEILVKSLIFFNPEPTIRKSSIQIGTSKPCNKILALIGDSLLGQNNLITELINQNNVFGPLDQINYHCIQVEPNFESFRPIISKLLSVIVDLSFTHSEFSELINWNKTSDRSNLNQLIRDLIESISSAKIPSIDINKLIKINNNINNLDQPELNGDYTISIVGLVKSEDPKEDSITYRNRVFISTENPMLDQFSLSELEEIMEILNLKDFRYQNIREVVFQRILLLQNQRL